MRPPQDANLDLPLAGVVILDLTWLLPGPFCTHILKELGAEVIKVERPEGGDYLRDLLPEAYMLVNRGKKSIAIDLMTEPGKAEFDYLMKECDVVVESFRPGVARKLNVDYASLAARNPKLVYLSISGYGQTGPLATAPGHDVNYLAIAGALSIPAHWGQPPRRSGLPMADLAGGLYGALNVVAALKKRDATGEGAYIDLSIAESVLHWTQIRFADHVPSSDDTPLWEHVWPGNDVFMTKDGRPIALGIVETKFWSNFGAAAGWLDVAALADAFEGADSDQSRRAAGDRLYNELTKRIALHDREYWLDALSKHDVPHSVVNDESAVFQEPHFKHRNVWEETAGLSRASIKAVSLPGGVYRGATGSAPRLDEHGDEIRAALAEQVRARRPSV